MPFLRTSVVAAVAVFSASTCGKTDPPEIKPVAAPEVSLKGVDTAALTPRERRDWSSQVSELLAPCKDVPVSIAACVNEGRACKTCRPAAEFLLKQVQAGKSKKEREDAFHARFDPGKTKTVVTGGSPEIGSPDAVVTIVEWADFECPFCRAFYPVLDEIVHKYPTQVRLVFKFYPLQSHPHGEPAAHAAVAALNQGKFWEMHHALFDNQEHLEGPDLEAYAKKIGLDLGKFRADFGSKELGERIEKDRKQAEELGLEGTPFVLINGRVVNLTYLSGGEDVLDWVKLEIELAGQTPRSALDGGDPHTPAGALDGGDPSAPGSGRAPATSASAGPSPKK